MEFAYTYLPTYLVTDDSFRSPASSKYLYCLLPREGDVFAALRRRLLLLLLLHLGVFNWKALEPVRNLGLGLWTYKDCWCPLNQNKLRAQER